MCVYYIAIKLSATLSFLPIDSVFMFYVFIYCFIFATVILQENGLHIAKLCCDYDVIYLFIYFIYLFLLQNRSQGIIN